MRYEIKGDNLPVVIMNLESGESIITQGGGMAWMSPNMHMETTSRGGIGKLLGRALSGDTLFQNIYTAENGNGVIAVASSFPGEIRKFEITPDKPMIMQKSAFLCSEKGVELSVYFKKNLGTGLFGGEGFIMQMISGTGTCFAEFDGSVVEYELKEGQQIIMAADHAHLQCGSRTAELLPFDIRLNRDNKKPVICTITGIFLCLMYQDERSESDRLPHTLLLPSVPACHLKTHPRNLPPIYLQDRWMTD